RIPGVLRVTLKHVSSAEMLWTGGIQRSSQSTNLFIGLKMPNEAALAIRNHPQQSRRGSHQLVSTGGLCRKVLSSICLTRKSATSAREMNPHVQSPRVDQRAPDGDRQPAAAAAVIAA